MASAFEFYGTAETAETQLFAKTFDKFFDCLNVRNLDEHRKKRKPNLKPYRNPDDERLAVSYLLLTCTWIYVHSRLHETIYYICNIIIIITCMIAHTYIAPCLFLSFFRLHRSDSN